jgi:hypothetical protein
MGGNAVGTSLIGGGGSGMSGGMGAQKSQTTFGGR